MVSDTTIAAVRPPPKFLPTPAEREAPLSQGQDLHFPCHIRVRFPTPDPAQHVQVDAMIDSGNRVPGSAVISEHLMHAMGVQRMLIPDNTQILTANEEGQPLQVIGKLKELYMAVSHTLILHLYHVTVVRNLSHPLNLGGYFLKEFGTRLCFDMQPPCLWARGEFIPLRGVPIDRETAERELSYEGPLPGPLPEQPRVVEKGTHWVDAELNAHKGANLLAMGLPPVPKVPRESLPTTFPEIASPPEPIFSSDIFINGQPCPPGPLYLGPPASPPAKPESRPVKSRSDVPGATLNSQAPASPGAVPVKSRPDAHGAKAGPSTLASPSAEPVKSWPDALGATLGSAAAASPSAEPVK